MPVRLAAARVALVVGTSGCLVFHRGTADPRPAFDVPEGEIALNVTNHNYLDVVIYVVHDGQQTRVGTVPSRAGRLLSGRRSPPGLLLEA